MGGRYHFEESQKTIEAFNQLFGLKGGSGRGGGGYSALFPGSGGPLDLALMSNIGPDKPLVYGDPSYEQGPGAADTMKAPKFPVPLTATYAHDVKAMVAAHPSPGAYYIVNPNNPTGTMTPKADIVWLLQNKPKGSVVIVDEAYHHFSNDESCIDLVAQDKDIIVMRTFSKIYGMAGLRAGFAIASPDLLAKFQTVAPPGRSVASISITSAAAARASLQDKDLVPLRRKINADVRSETLEFLTKKGYKIIPGSQANFFMVDVKRPGREFGGSDDEGERRHRPHLAGAANLRPRHRRHQGRDGEVPDGLRQVHGHRSRHRQRSSRTSPARLRQCSFRTVPRLLRLIGSSTRTNGPGGQLPGLFLCSLARKQHRSGIFALRNAVDFKELWN